MLEPILKVVRVRKLGELTAANVRRALSRIASYVILKRSCDNGGTWH